MVTVELPSGADNTCPAGFYNTVQLEGRSHLSKY